MTAYWYIYRLQCYYYPMIVYGWDGGCYIMDDFGNTVEVFRSH